MGNNKNKAGNPPGAFLAAALAFLLVIALALAAGLGLHLHQQRQAAHHQASTFAARQAQALATELAALAHDDQQQLEALAAPPPDRLAGPAGPGPWLAGSRLIWVPATTSTHSLSFTVRDLLQQLKDEAATPVSARGGDQPAILAARALPEGALILEHRLGGWLQGALQRLPASSQLTLAQGDLTLARLGQAPAGAPHAQASAGPFTVTVALPAQAPTWQALLLPAGAMALVLLAGAGLVLVMLSQRLGTDGERPRHHGEPRRPDATPADEPVASAVPMPARAAQQRPQESAPPAAPPPGRALPEELFRAYDIRGVAEQMLDADAVALLGQAIGSEAGDAGQQTVFVARDGRLSGPTLVEALIRGLVASGRRVVDLGMAPAPVLYYATEVLESQSGVCLTGSHNPPEYNGLKVVIKGETYYGEQLQALRQRIIDNRLGQGQGSVEQRDINQRYQRALTEDIVLARPMRVAVDCGNGATGPLAPALFEALGCKVVPLYTETDGHFPHHPPDPSQPDNLAALAEAVKSGNLDLGIAFDGDGDRLGVVASDGEIIAADRLIMLFARDLLGRSPGSDVLFDVKCSRALPTLVRKLGGRPVMYKTGRPLIRARMKELGAPLAGEMSGHIFFADRWFGFDDALYAAARLLEILSLEQGDSAGVFAGLRTGVTTPELAIAVSEANKFRLMQALTERAGRFPGGRANTVDGLRVDFPDGWGLVRASNTTPALVTRFEGRDQQALERIQALFREQLNAVDDGLGLPF